MDRGVPRTAHQPPHRPGGVHLHCQIRPRHWHRYTAVEGDGDLERAHGEGVATRMREADLPSEENPVTARKKSYWRHIYCCILPRTFLFHKSLHHNLSVSFWPIPPKSRPRVWFLGQLPKIWGGGLIGGVFIGGCLCFEFLLRGERFWQWAETVQEKPILAHVKWAKPKNVKKIAHFGGIFLVLGGVGFFEFPQKSRGVV